MVEWPDACVGCGKTNTRGCKVFTEHIILHKDALQSTRYENAYKTWEIKYSICDNCFSSYRKNFIIKYLLLFALIVVSSIILATQYNLALGSKNYDPTIIFLIVGPSSIFFIVFFVARLKDPSSLFWNVKKTWKNKTPIFTFRFKNEKFGEYFRKSNGGFSISGPRPLFRG